MLLQGNRKKLLMDSVQYYVDTTDRNCENFVEGLLAYQCGQLNTAEYHNWLLNEIIETLKDKDISINDCIENKDVIRSVVHSQKVWLEGEYYTPEVWCQTAREYIRRMLGDKWGTINVLDMCAGAGNLMKTADYPADKLFMSTLLHEDVRILKQVYPNSTVFQCDFLKDIDYDENNKNFSDKLPENMRKLFENDEPILFFMNPPYRQGKAGDTDVGAYMSANNMRKASSDLLYQSVYRVIMLKRFYNLHHVYLAFFGGPAWLYSAVLSRIKEELQKEFDFHSGMYFPNGDFTSTSSTILWAVTFTMWQPKGLLEKPNELWLDARTKISDTESRVVGGRLFERPSMTLQEWTKAKDVIAQTQDLFFQTFGVTNNTLGKRGLNAMAQLMTDDHATQLRTNCLINGATVDAIDITHENFERAVASYVARMCFKRIMNPYNSSQCYSKPDTEAEGYREWYYNAVILFTFDWGNRVQSYRNFEGAGELWNFSNPFFPLSMDEVKLLTDDPVILQDMEQFPCTDTFFLEKFREAVPHLTPIGREFYEFCMQALCGSFKARKDEMQYSNYTNTWDASLMQVRRANGYWTKEMEDTYFRLARAFKDELQVGIYKYGFLKHYSSSLEDLRSFTFTEADLERMSTEVETEGEYNDTSI